ncbi:MAG: 3,4-dihydroxy-2-butanone-4-phosphate synthase [Gammaproteobacteria bacterium]|nr:MAG: 3,4-dihydroxy-2-butanone-4-phosphate synthase [Gammaproteobacteria bacterium]
MPLNTIEDIIADIRAGKMVILMDDEGRENEGDLIMAAIHVRPEDINFMARYGRGLICLTLTRERCAALRLPLMVSDNYTQHGTNFTLSIEAARGVSTGISAQDRARTIRAAVAPNAQPSDLVQPGHIFPLMAQPGGVLTRAGHTEAACDLAYLAGLEPAGVIVEILNEDGSMARRADLEKFAREHGLKIGTIADLIRYRVQSEKTVQRVSDTRVQTGSGEFRLVTYRDTMDNELHLALVRGVIEKDKPAPVRVHLPTTCDALGMLRADGNWTLHSALQYIAAQNHGVVVVLRRPETPDELLQRLEQRGAAHEAAEDIRTYGVGAQILADLGVRKMRVLSAPKKIHALSGFDLEIVEYLTPPQAGK